MNPSIYILLMIILSWWLMLRDITVHNKVIKKRKPEEKREMVEFAKRFIDKDCVIRTFNSSCFTGVLKEVSEHAILIENDNNSEIINLEYVINIKEPPTNQNGKKKAIYY